MRASVPARRRRRRRTLEAEPSAPLDHVAGLGRAVALDGDLLLLGAPYAPLGDVPGGAVRAAYAFVREGAGWRQGADRAARGGLMRTPHRGTERRLPETGVAVQDSGPAP
jgi:hypothetical protein